MPRNGTGQMVITPSSWSPATNGTLATAGDWTALLNDLAAALTQSVSRDGQSPMLGNLNLANNKITNLAAGTATTDAATWAQLFGASTQADIASAATVDIGVQNTSFLRVTGTTTITSFGSNYRGPRFLTFAGAVTLTNSSTLVLPGNANITTAAGDSLIVIPGATLGTADRWVVVAYQSGVPLSTANVYTKSETYSKTETEAFAVKLTGDQTIAGVKTFSSSPEVPNATTSNQAAAFGQIAGAFTQSLAANGWQRLPSGLIIQWGRTSSISGTETITFPIAFPTSVYQGFATLRRSGSVAGNVSAYFESISLTQAQITHDAVDFTGSTPVQWFAIGR